MLWWQPLLVWSHSHLECHSESCSVQQQQQRQQEGQEGQEARWWRHHQLLWEVRLWEVVAMMAWWCLWTMVATVALQHQVARASSVLERAMARRTALSLDVSRLQSKRPLPMLSSPQRASPTCWS